MRTTELDLARDALKACDPSCSREEWVEIAMGFKAVGGAFDDFDAWSRDGKSYDPKAVAATWKSINGNGAVTSKTLYRNAVGYGWVNPNSQRDAPSVWAQCQPATASHPYIVAKNGIEDGLRVLPFGDPLTIGNQPMAGSLVVPVIPLGGSEPVSLQFIPAPGSGQKMNLPRAKMEGVFVVGELSPDAPVYLVEGIGQGWACTLSTGAASVVCFGWGNVGRVAQEMRAHDAAQVLVVVPDRGKETAAQSVAREAQCLCVAMPGDWKNNDDINDLMKRDGRDAVRALLQTATAPSSETPSSVERVERDQAAAPLTATPFVPFDPTKLPPRPWIFGHHYLRGYVGVDAGAGGVSKSMRMLVDAVSMVIGRDLLGRDRVYGGAKRVWVMNLEDDKTELHRRIGAICLRYDIDQSNLSGLYIDSGRDRELIIARETREGVDINVPDVAAVKAELIAKKIDVLQVDPFVECHTVSESLNDSIKIVMAEWRQIAHDSDAAVSLAHHLRKNGGIEASIDDVRGASAMIGSARSVRLYSAMTTAEANDFGIDPKERRRYVGVNPHGKGNFAPPNDARDWYYLESIALRNVIDAYPDGDRVGVPVVWSLPGPLAGLTAEDCAGIKALAAAQADPGVTARANKTAGGWFGNLVARRLDIDIADAEGRKEVERILAALVKNKWLSEGFAKDQKRELKPVFLPYSDEAPQ